MANTYVEYTGNGSEQDYTITFPYLRSSHLVVRVSDSVTTEYGIDGQTLTFDDPPANGASIEIRRVTPRGSLIRRFYDGPNPTGTELEEAFKQSIYALQEVEEGTIDGTSIEIPANSLTVDRIEQVGQNYVLGRTSSGTGDVEKVAMTDMESVLGITEIEAKQDAPLFRGSLTNNQSITKELETTVAFGTEAYDTNTCYDPVTYKFTPTKAGYYLLFSRVAFTSGEVGKKYTVMIKRNGTSIVHGDGDSIYSQGTDPVHVKVTALAYANGSTDYFVVSVYHNSATDKTISNSESNFFGFRVR